LAWIALVAVLAAAVDADTTGQLAGLVVDDDGSPLPGVAVTAASPSQIGGEQLTQTDIRGWFQYPRLAPGFYTVRLALDGFVTQELTAVQVRVDRMTELRVTLPLARFADEVVVTETTPVIDPEQVFTGQTFTNEYIRETRSDFWELSYQAPGTASPSGDNQDSNWRRVSGSTPTDNSYYLDGVQATRWDERLPNMTLGFIPFDAVQETVLHTGGFEAEYGQATGGVLNLITKSGGNRFAGTVDVAYTDTDLATSGEHFDPEDQPGDDLLLNLTFGGPILRDQLWFFTAFQNSSYEETPRGAPTTIEGGGPTLFGKMTWQASPSWSLMGRLSRQSGVGKNIGSSPFTASEATARWDIGEDLGSVELVGVLSDAVLWSLRTSRREAEEAVVRPESGDLQTIAHFNLVTGESYGNYWGQWSDTSSRNQVESDVTWFFDGWQGSHELKAGLGYGEPKLVSDQCYNGSGQPCTVGVEGFFFEDAIDNSGRAIPSGMWVAPAPGEAEYGATYFEAYAQDAWRLRPGLTLQLGLRWDRVVHENNLGREIADFSKLQPRVGVAWDVTGNGRNLLRASWGRFMNTGTGILTNSTNELRFASEELWLSCSTEIGIADPGACAAASQALGFGHRLDPEGWDPAGWVLVPWLVFSSEPSQTVDGLRPNFVDQWMIGFERELFRRTAFEVSYINKKGKDFFEDTCNGNVPEPSPDAACDFYVIANWSQLRSEYEAVWLRVESRALDRLHLLASWVIADEQGSSGFNSGITETFDQYPVHFENRFGYLPTQSRHRLKLSGFVRLPYDFSLAVFGWWDSDFRWTPVQSARAVDPRFYGEVFVEPRGNRKEDGVRQLDLQLGKGFRLGPTRLKLIGTIINLFDSEQPREVCNRVNGCGGFELGEPTAWQLPRRYELGVRLEF
jgi:hypothetical protein